MGAGDFCGAGNVAVAQGAVIENATGGAGADLINGNSSANVLRGGLATRNVIDEPESDGFDLTGSPGADAFALVADTVIGVENYWLSTFQLDTLVIDSMRVDGTQGGFVTDFRGGDRSFERREYVAASGAIHSKLQKLIAGALR